MGRGQAYQTAIHSVGHGLGNDTSERAEGVFGVPFIVFLLEESLKSFPCEPTNLIRSKFGLYVDSDSLSVIQQRCFLQIVLAVILHPVIQKVGKTDVRRSLRQTTEAIPFPCFKSCFFRFLFGQESSFTDPLAFASDLSNLEAIFVCFSTTILDFWNNFKRVDRCKYH